MAEEKSTKRGTEGAEELLVEWGYSLNELAFGSKEGSNTFREIERAAATHWFASTVGKLPKTKTAYEATVKYRDLADERGVIDKKNFKLEEKGETIFGTFLSQNCPYKECCINRKRDGKEYLCFRTAPFVTAVRLMADKEYQAKVIYNRTQPGKVCSLEGTPTERAFTVGLSYKLGRGTVKLHETDCTKLGLDLIDTITVVPSRKELEGKSLAAMSYSQTRFPAGMAVLNVADAKSLGLEEKDTVYIRKGGEVKTELVEVDEYEARPGEYDVAGLEAPEAPKEEVEAPEEAKEATLEEKPPEDIKAEEAPLKKPKAPEKKAPKPPKEKPAKKPVKAPEEKPREAPTTKPPAPVAEALPKETPKKPSKKKKSPANKKQMQEFEAKIEAIRNE